MNKIFSILLISFGLFLYSQPRITGNLNMKPEKIVTDTLGKSHLNVYYKTYFVSDAERPNAKREAVTILLLGKENSMFVDVNRIKSDSLTKQMESLKTITTKEFNELYKYNPKWKPYLFKNITNNSVVFQNFISKSYQYEEPISIIDWRIDKEEKEILGYSCVKATAEFRGRNYTAWFAKDLPFQNGPYTLGGLPGLIMELYDDKDHYRFTAIGIDKEPKDIYIKTSDILKIARDKYRMVEKSHHENPSFSNSGMAYNVDGTPMKLKEIPYNPIELK